MFYQCLELFEKMDAANANTQEIAGLFAQRNVKNIHMQDVIGPAGKTGFIRIVIPGSEGKLVGGNKPTLGIIGRLGGIGARPEIMGFVSDGDGALCALAAGLKLADMASHGDRLPGDVMVCTHICPNAPTIEHQPVRLMGSPVKDAEIGVLEAAYPADALLSIDTSKGNRIFCRRGFAITPTIKDGYILRVSEDLMDIMGQVTGCAPAVLPVTMQDITPYGNGIYHLNSILQPSVFSAAPVVGVAITSEIPVAGCATGATQISDVEQAARFAVETAKEFTSGRCQFYDTAELALLQEKYGDMRILQK